MTDREALAALLTDLFPVVSRSWWPFTVEQAADALIASGVSIDPRRNPVETVSGFAPSLDEGLRDWWGGLSADEQFDAYLIEKSNADTLTAALAGGECVCGAREHRGECHFGWHKPGCPDAAAGV